MEGGHLPKKVQKCQVFKKQLLSVGCEKHKHRTRYQEKAAPPLQAEILTSSERKQLP